MDHRELCRADGTLVIRLRRERGWSRGRLAQAAGVSHHTVAKIERGDAVFPATLAEVAAALGLPPAGLRAAGEAAPAVTPASARLIDAVRDRYALYHAAIRGGGFGLLRREFPKGLSRSIRWSYAATRTVPFDGAYIGPQGVLGYFETMFATARPTDHRIEQLVPLGGREILARGIEAASIVGVGFVTGAWLHVHAFDRRGRLIECRSSFDILSVKPEPQKTGG
jgi:transcriptional regulator with XRE-family HTH domain